LKPILAAYFSAIHEQSADINQGVDRANPEDQGARTKEICSGYATNETRNLAVLGTDYSRKLNWSEKQITKFLIHVQMLNPATRVYGG
jgi:S-adenosylmethionine synthetase